MLRIAVDAALPDAEGPVLRAQLQGAALAADGRQLEYVFTGPKAALERELERLAKEGRAPRARVLDAPPLPSSEDDPQRACRENPDSSVMRAAGLVAERSASAMVSMSGPGTALAASLWHIKRLKGVLRCALACSVPTPRGTSLLIDAGAQVDSKPWHLLQFALMGSLYSRHVLGVEGPSVGLLAAPTGELARETVPLLRHLGLHFQGVLRGEDLTAGSADVIVCDGDIGSMTLGLYQGLYCSYFEMLNSELDSNLAGRIGGLIARRSLHGFRDRSRSACSGGAPILGLGGSVVLCRDPRSPESVAESIRSAAALSESGVHERIRERLEDAKSDLESARAAR